MLRLTIDGKACECAEGSTLLSAIRAAGVDVPALCHDPRLEPIGACRLCVVHVHGVARPVTSCNTVAAAGMQVETHTAEIERLRRTNLRLLANQYPPEPFSRFPDKPFHRYLRQYGLERELAGVADGSLVDESHPYIRVDMSQCIDCFRCVRICEEVQGQFVWRVWNRGDRLRILPDSGTTLAESNCVSCGACVDTCPTGALEDQSAFRDGGHTEWTRTTCPYCGTGCEMYVGSSGDRVVAARPVPDAPVSKGHLCVKGRYAHAFGHASDRVTEPMIRRDGRWTVVPWDEAIGHVAERLRDIIARHGPDAVGVLGSARATNEENYLTQKFARVVLGTNNVDCCARVCHAPTAAGMKMVLGTGAATNSFDDIERARAILVCGANPTENHPVVGARIRQAVLKGAPLVVIDPRRIELAEHADVHLALRPGTNVPLLNAIASVIVSEGLHDEPFVRERVSGWEEYRSFLRDWGPESVAPICGVEPEAIRRAARVYATAKPAICFHGLGVTEHVQGTEGVVCLVNLALLTGNIGKPGSGVNPLRGQNNVQGAAHMGCDPGVLPGSVALEAGRERTERVLGVPLPRSPGLNLMQMLDAARDGRLRAMWAIGYDIALTNPNAARTRDALKAMELVIVQDLFEGEIARHAGVFLPAASSFEKDGTFMNAERRVQRVRRAIAPRGNSRPDRQIICDLARAMGYGHEFAFRSPEEVWNEVRAVWPAGCGITYERLELGGLQWPCPSEDHPGTAVLHADGFASGTQAELRRVDYAATSERVSADYPLLLVTGRTLYQFNAGTMTMRTRNTLLRPADRLDIATADAARLNIRDGQRVRVRSRYGEAMLPARVTSSVKAGEVFATFHTSQVFLNALTSDRRDAVVDTPEFKVTAVRVEPA
jgi:formate dehydrogenase major subunit